MFFFAQNIYFTGRFAPHPPESAPRGSHSTPLSFSYACVFRNMWFAILFIYLLARWKLKSTKDTCTLNSRWLTACVKISY